MLRESVYYSEYEYIENIIKEPFLNGGKSFMFLLLFVLLIGLGYFSYINRGVISSFLEPNMVFMQEYNQKENKSTYSDEELQLIANQIVKNMESSGSSILKESSSKSEERILSAPDENFNELMMTLDALSKELKSQEVRNGR